MNKLYGYERAIDNSRIVSIQVNLLNECTSVCKSCRKYTWPKYSLDINILREALHILKHNFGLQTVVFSGGDPLLYEHLPELIDYCVKKDIKYSLITTLISEDEWLLEKIAKTAERIHLSLDAADAETYKMVRGVDKFDLVEKNIMFVSKIRREERKSKIRISSTISKLNCKQTFDIFKIADLYSCDINFYLVHTWDDLKMDMKEVNEFYSTLMVIKNAWPVGNIYGNVSNAEQLLIERYADEKVPESCYINKIHALIDADGSIYPCCKLLNDNGEYKDQIQYSYGNIYSSDIIMEFERRKMHKYPLNCELCKECSSRYIGINRYFENFKNKKMKPLFL